MLTASDHCFMIIADSSKPINCDSPKISTYRQAGVSSESELFIITRNFFAGSSDSRSEERLISWRFCYPNRSPFRKARLN